MFDLFPDAVHLHSDAFRATQPMLPRSCDSVDCIMPFVQKPDGLRRVAWGFRAHRCFRLRDKRLRLVAEPPLVFVSMTSEHYTVPRVAYPEATSYASGPVFSRHVRTVAEVPARSEKQAVTTAPAHALPTSSLTTTFDSLMHGDGLE